MSPAPAHRSARPCGALMSSARLPRLARLPRYALLSATLITSACASTQAPLGDLRAPRLETPDGPERHQASSPTSSSEATRRLTIDALPTFRSASIPPGLRCLLRLQRLGVPYRPLPPMATINTPVQITGPVAGVTYRPTWRASLIVDCRFALALHRAGPFFRALGVSTAYFSNTYRKHHGSRRKMSRHALGLAMDLHRVRDDRGELLRVKRDYERDLDDACEETSRPTLNRLACLLKRHGVFDYVLTPDTNRAHYNHFHLSILDLERRRKARRRRAHPIIHD